MQALRRAVYLALLFFLLLLFLCHSAPAIQGVRHGLSLCIETVFPALFPFLVLSELILSSGAGATLGRLLSRPLRAVFGLSAAGSGALVLGTLCGQPVASCAAASLYEKGQITKKEAERLSLFANNPGSGFVIAAVGGTLFGNVGAGVALFAITMLSSAFLGIILHLLFKKSKEILIAVNEKVRARPTSLLFTEAIRRALSTLLQIGAFILFFSALTSVLGELLAYASFEKEGCAILFGILELTTGICNATSYLPAYTAFRTTAFLCGFGGLCVCMQILSIAEKCGISIWKYLLAKLVQGGVALLLCEGYLRVFAPILAPNKALPTLALTAHFPMLGGILFLLLLALLLRKKNSLSKN